MTITSKLMLSEERYRRLFETAQDGILLLDASTGMIIDANPFMYKLTGYSIEELLNKAIWDLGFFKNVAENKVNFLELQTKGYVRYENLPIETKSGEISYVEFVSNSYFVGTGKIIQCNIRDISYRVSAEKINSELKMMYKVILLCNQVLLHETSIDVLIEEMCKVLISSGGFRGCWVSLALSESEHVIKPIAVEGIEKDYFKHLNKRIKENSTQGLIISAIRLNQLLICQDIKNEEQDSFERKLAIKNGYSSVAVIPINPAISPPYIDQVLKLL